MNAFISFVTSSPEVSVFAGLIFIFAAYAFWFWFRPAVREVTTGVNAIQSALLQEPKSWSEAGDRVRTALKTHPNLASTWLETEERVIEVVLGGEQKAVMFGSPKDLWSSPALLSRRFNYSLAEAVPNMLVGVGLFFTFVFLSWALVETTASLTAMNSTARQTEEAISELLQVAGGKFLTSLTGLLASITWTYKSKRALNELAKSCDALLGALAKVVPVNGSELLMRQQLEAGGDGLGLTEELLNEAREQTGTFKRFETDLAITLAGAITKSFSPQMEAMTAKLVAAIDNLTDRLGTMNQEALQKMLEDFAAMLKQATNSEMAQLRQTLTELSAKLEGAGVSFGAGATDAATAINEAGAQLVARVQEIAQNLSTGATNLETAAGSVKLAMNDLEVTLHEASGIGRRGAEFVNQALDMTGQTIESLGSISGGLTTAATALESVSGKVGDIVDNVEELSREQRSVVAAVREVAPSALSAVERMTDIFNEAGKQTKQSMEATAETLKRTVATITEGVTAYTEQVAELHRTMDGHLAKAVGSFDKGVNELAESVEELSETMQAGQMVEAVNGFEQSTVQLASSVKEAVMLARQQKAA
jgi:methyl-accepting chemotaxis protein